MNKMQLASDQLPQNVGRPSSRTDFDLMIGSHEFKLRRHTSFGSIWGTSLSNNLMGLLFSIILWPATIFFATADLRFSRLPLWQQVVLGLFACIGVVATLLLTALIFYLRRLIVDHDAGELRFCRWTNKPYHVLHFRDIRGMTFENVQHFSGSDS